MGGKYLARPQPSRTPFHAGLLASSIFTPNCPLLSTAGPSKSHRIPKLGGVQNSCRQPGACFLPCPCRTGSFWVRLPPRLATLGPDKTSLCGLLGVCLSIKWTAELTPCLIRLWGQTGVGAPSDFPSQSVRSLYLSVLSRRLCVQSLRFGERESCLLEGTRSI